MAQATKSVPSTAPTQGDASKTSPTTPDLSQSKAEEVKPNLVVKDEPVEQAEVVMPDVLRIAALKRAKQMAKRKWFRIKLLSGQHTQDDREGNSVTYERGAVFEAPSDLEARLGSKFKRVGSEVPLTAPSGGTLTKNRGASTADPLDEMSLPELCKVAEEEEIDITGCLSKQDIIAAIRSV